jgi:hypothetical protein
LCHLSLALPVEGQAAAASMPMQNAEQNMAPGAID